MPVRDACPQTDNLPIGGNLVIILEAMPAWQIERSKNAKLHKNLGFPQYLLLAIGRHRLVMVELHRKRAASLRRRAKRGRVAEHLGQRNSDSYRLQAG